MQGNVFGMAIVAGLFAAGNLMAQQQPSQAQQQPAPQGGGDSATIPPPIYSSGSSINTSSTAVEGGLRGSASVIQAAGEYNYNTAAGMAAAAEAASKGIENEAAALNNYFTLKAMNDNYQLQHRGPRTTGQQAAYISRITAPKRLSTYQLDSATGEISWPAVLQRRRFAAHRQQLEELFAEREKTNSGIGTPTYEEIVDATDAFQQVLKGQIDALTPAEYVVAKRFLTSLRHEAQFAPAIDGVANSN